MAVTRRAGCLLVLHVLLLAGLPEPVSSTPTPARVPDCPTVTKRVTGKQTRGIRATNAHGTWNLRRALWDENAPDPITYPVRSDAWTRGCLVGGTVLGGVPRRWTRDQWYDGEDGGTQLKGEAFRLTLTNTRRNFLRIEEAFVEDYEDAFDPNAARWSSTTYLTRVHAHFIRDDCVENEKIPHNMVIRDSLFDGCFTAFAQRPDGSTVATNGKGPHRFVVKNSLVYVRPQRLGPDYCGSAEVTRGRCRVDGKNVWLGSYGIWKWSNQAAGTVRVRNTIFRLDMPSYVSCRSQRWPAGDYKKVKLVWTGKGRYSTAGRCTNPLPKGVKLTRNIKVWKAARRAWLSQ